MTTTKHRNLLLFSPVLIIAVLSCLALVGVVYGGFLLLKALCQSVRKGGWFVRGRMAE